MNKITLKEYVLTNINLKEHCFTIRLRDNKKYIVYRKKQKKPKNNILHKKR